MILYQSHQKIDWFDVLERLIDGYAVKIYCHNSQETLLAVKVDDTLLIQNNKDKVAAIHNSQSIGYTINGILLEALVDTSLYENDIKDISLIETVDFGITLIELD